MERRRKSHLFRKILVGYDGSETADKAVEVAIHLAGCMDSSIVVLAVARPPEPATRVEVDAVLDDAKEHFQEGFERVVNRARDEGVNIETAIEVGHPAEHLIHRAETENSDLIIVGRRGTSLFTKLIVGSVSEQVLRYAHCPVMMVK